MGFPLDMALRYMGSKKRASISVGTMFAILGVMVGVSALITTMSVTGGFRSEFQDKVLGVNAHVLVMKYSSDFPEYREVMDQMREVPGVIGVAPFVINPMMVTHEQNTATGVLLKGVDPQLMASVLDLPKHIVAPPECDAANGGDPAICIGKLRLAGAAPPERRRTGLFDLPEPEQEDREDHSILDVIGERIKEGEAAERDAGSPDEGDEPGEPAPGTSATEGRATTPDEGWGSRFLDEDPDRVEELPGIVWTDPCKDPSAGGLPGIIVGKSLLTNLQAEVGSCIQVTSPTIGYTYQRGAIRAPVAKQFRVVGVFSAGFDQYDSKLVYTDLYAAQAFYDNGDSVTGVEMKVDDIARSGAIKAGIDQKLANGLYHTMDWMELNHGLFTALKIQQILMSIVLALIIVVAAFTVIATLIMVVLDKKKEIAVLKAMGASDLHLLRTFLYQGGIIGVAGTVLGLALGYGLLQWLVRYGFPLDPKVYFISRLPVQIRPDQFVLVGLFAVIVCLTATVWPALFAARLRPADAFREQ